ncbi:MAG: penicillin acylase family protein, partial [Gemmatimonadota bacterium]
VGAELSWGRAVAAIGPERVKEIGFFNPSDPDLELDPSITGEMLAEDILGLYNAFRRSIQFQPDDIIAQYRGDQDTYERLARSLPDEMELGRQGEQIGSNNWIVDGTRTSSRQPIMVNDPHRAIAAPALRYWAHLVAPGWNVIGGGEPVLPGLSIGHNEYGAWGLTVFSTDSEDLYVYDVNPANPNQYRYEDGWEDMRVIRESIPVRGQAASTVELKYTRHGPVVFEDPDNDKAYAVRAGWMEIGGAPYLASLRMDQARSWEEFREASTYSHIPGENMIWADVDGNIGWQPVGITPIRRNYSGLVPVPGDGRFDWDGYLPIAELPHILNPEEGFWGNGNDFVVPLDYDRMDVLTPGGWNDPYRGDRVREMIGISRKLTVADMMKFQNDELSIPARTLTPILLELEPTSERMRDALELLRGWDYVLDERSLPAGIYVEWERQVMRNMYETTVPVEARPHISNLSMKRSIDGIITPDDRFGPDPVAGRNALLLESLDLALDELTRKLGPDMANWRYGQPDYKHSLQQHPLSAAVSPELRDRLEVGTLPRGGYSHTVNNTGGGDNQTSGASFRLIAPVDDWDLAVGTMTPGQSGDPDAPTYRDLYPLWATGQYFPVFYSRPRIDGVAKSVTLMGPAR